MLLRHKFGLLALIYVLSLSATVIISGWCIAVYFQSAFSGYQVSTQAQDAIERLRVLVRRQRTMFEEGQWDDEHLVDCARLQSEISAGLSRVEPMIGRESGYWEAIQRAAEKKDSLVARLRAIQSAPGGANKNVGGVLKEALGGFEDLDRALVATSRVFSRRRQGDVEKAAATEQRVVGVLVVNAACGALICVLGLVLMWRWILRPVGDLREATREIGRGNLSYKVARRSGDELGQLADEVNEMSAMILQMQNELVENERLAAAGEMLGRIAHNIRNPLSGIRGLAETTLELGHEHPEARNCQQRIINSVDQFEKWLRELEQSVRPMNLNLERVCIADLIDNVIKALQPMYDRRGVRVETRVSGDLCETKVDRLHFEQALVALVTNAVQATERGDSVRIGVEAVADKPDHWRLTVEDPGVGIPHELQEKIFRPYFTTKQNGTGVGLALASKVVKMHGGQLTVESESGRGAKFAAVLPGLVAGE